MPLPESAPKVPRTLARDDAYNRLRAWIIDGTLKPAEVLHDHAIGSALGVSRTPVREALRRLEDEGLVETALNRWTRVAALDLTKISETYAIIEALEVLALEQAFPTLTRDDVQSLEDANRAMQKVAKHQDPAVAVIADEDFHELLVSRANNGELLLLLRQLKTKLRRVELAYFEAAPRAHASFREHTAIIKALQERSLSRACTALRLNWSGSLERLRKLAEKKTSELPISNIGHSAPVRE
jgi:DNA-binding GntR family transcriptional regulator